MKIRSIFITAFVLVASAGFTQEKADTAKNKAVDRPGPTATGKVIHRDNKNCPVVVEVIDAKRKDTAYYIPFGTSLDGFDKEGTIISFKFRHLMVKNPLGCTGSPVTMWDIKKAGSSKSHRKSKKAK